MHHPPPSTSPLSQPDGDDWLGQFQQELGQAALRLGGFHHLSWNRRIARLPDPDIDARAVGMADWDGTLYVHQRWVVEPLRRLQENWGRRQPVAALRKYKDAIATLLHETYHMASPADHDQVEGRSVYDQPSTVFLEEGVTELYTHHRLDDVIRETGLDKAAPGICDVRIEPSYPDYVPGTRSLLDWVSDRLGVQYTDVLEYLAEHTAAGKYPQLCRLVLVQTGLAAAIPPAAWWACRRELEQAIRTELDVVATFPARESPDVVGALSRDAGRHAAGALDEVLTGLRARAVQRGPEGQGMPAPAPGDHATPTMEVER